ncbi:MULTISPECIES: RICIN domain-containing protein [unclassified Streptomyces]|uniref:RICIN domain-containing protein n=1 Tax=Streptomyces sp. NPDC127129 TaxID=3345373 RepID=UPI00362501C3
MRKSIFAVFAALLVAFAMNVSVASDASAATYYELKNRYSGKCATPKGNGTSNGTVITLWDCTGSSLQHWEMRVAGSGNQIVHRASGKCLTPSGNGYATDGAVLTLWTCDNSGTNYPQQFSANQSWTWTTYSNPNFRCLTNKGGSHANGTYLTLWRCADDYPTEQQWVFDYA